MVYEDGSYCPRCGYISYYGTPQCRRCWPKPIVQTLIIPPEYKLSFDDWHENDISDYTDEEALRQSREEWDRRKRFFYEDFLVKQPGFDPNLYWYDREKEDKLMIEREEKRRQDREEILARREGKISANNPSGVKCTYCGSNNCKKISAVSRGILGGLFGVASPALGKQWHCNNCGSKF